MRFQIGAARHCLQSLRGGQCSNEKCPFIHCTINRTPKFYWRAPQKPGTSTPIWPGPTLHPLESVISDSVADPCLESFFGKTVAEVTKLCGLTLPPSEPPEDAKPASSEPASEEARIEVEALPPPEPARKACWTRPQEVAEDAPTQGDDSAFPALTRHPARAGGVASTIYSDELFSDHHLQSETSRIEDETGQEKSALETTSHSLPKADSQAQTSRHERPTNDVQDKGTLDKSHVDRSRLEKPHLEKPSSERPGLERPSLERPSLNESMSVSEDEARRNTRAQPVKTAPASVTEPFVVCGQKQLSSRELQEDKISRSLASKRRSLDRSKEQESLASSPQTADDQSTTIQSSTAPRVGSVKNGMTVFLPPPDLMGREADPLADAWCEENFYQSDFEKCLDATQIFAQKPQFLREFVQQETRRQAEEDARSYVAFDRAEMMREPKSADQNASQWFTELLSRLTYKPAEDMPGYPHRQNNAMTTAAAGTALEGRQSATLPTQVSAFAGQPPSQPQSRGPTNRLTARDLLAREQFSRESLNRSNFAEPRQPTAVADHLFRDHLGRSQLSRDQLCQDRYSQSALNPEGFDRESLLRDSLSRELQSNSAFQRVMLAGNINDSRENLRRDLMPEFAHRVDDRNRLNDQVREELARNDGLRPEFLRPEFPNNECNRNDFGRNEYGRSELLRSELERNGRGFGRNDYGRNDFGRNDLNRNDLSRNDFSRNEFNRNDFSRNDFSRTDFSRTEFSRSDFSRNEYIDASSGRRDWSQDGREFDASEGADIWAEAQEDFGSYASAQQQQQRQLRLVKDIRPPISLHAEARDGRTQDQGRWVAPLLSRRSAATRTRSPFCAQ